MDIIKKRITRFVLKKYINPYLERGLTTDQLEKANFGTLSINDLDLNPTVLNEYLEGLPLKVIGGSIGNIKIGIVVTSLKITVELSQLDILLGYTHGEDAEKKEENKEEINIKKIIEKNVEELQAEEEEIFGDNNKNKENLSSRQMLSDSLETTINNVSIKINQMRIRIQKFNEKINKHTALVLSIPQIVIESVKNDSILGLGLGSLNIKKRLILSNDFQILLYKSKKEDINMLSPKRILLFDSPKINLKTLEHSTIELTLDGSNIQLDANIKALRGALNPSLLNTLAQFFPFDYFNQSSTPPSPSTPQDAPPATINPSQSFFATPLVPDTPNANPNPTRTGSAPPELSHDLYSSIFESSLEVGNDESDQEFHDCDDQIEEGVFQDCEEESNVLLSMKEDKNSTESVIFESMMASTSNNPLKANTASRNRLIFNLKIYQVSVSFLYESYKTNQVFKHAWDGNRIKPPPYSIHDHFTFFLSGFTCSYSAVQDDHRMHLFWNYFGLIEYFFNNFNKNNLEYFRKNRKKNKIDWDEFFYIESDFYCNDLIKLIIKNEQNQNYSRLTPGRDLTRFLSECKNEITYQKILNLLEIHINLSPYEFNLSDDFLCYFKNYLIVFQDFMKKFSSIVVSNASPPAVPLDHSSNKEIIQKFNCKMESFTFKLKKNERFYEELRKLKNLIAENSAYDQQLQEFTGKYASIVNELATEKLLIDFQPHQDTQRIEITSSNFPKKLEISFSSITLSIQLKNRPPEPILHFNYRSNAKGLNKRSPISLEFASFPSDFNLASMENQFLQSDADSSLNWDEDERDYLKSIDVTTDYIQQQQKLNSQYGGAPAQRPPPSPSNLQNRKYQKTPIVKLRSVFEGQSQNPQIITDHNAFKLTAYDFSTCKISCHFPYMLFSASESDFHSFILLISEFLSNTQRYYDDFSRHYPPQPQPVPQVPLLANKPQEKSGIFAEFSINEGHFTFLTDSSQGASRFELAIDEFYTLYSSNYLFSDKSYLYTYLYQLQLSQSIQVISQAQGPVMNDSSGSLPNTTSQFMKSILISSLCPPTGTSSNDLHTYSTPKPPILQCLLEFLPNEQTNSILTVNQLYLKYQLGSPWPLQLSNYFLPPSTAPAASPQGGNAAPAEAGSKQLNMQCYLNVYDCSILYLPFDPSCFHEVSKCLITKSFQSSSTIQNLNHLQLNTRMNDVIIYLSSQPFNDNDLLAFMPSNSSYSSQYLSSQGYFTRIEQLGFLKIANLGVLKCNIEYDALANQIKVKLSNSISIIQLYQDAYTKLLPLYYDYCLFSTPVDPFINLVHQSFLADDNSPNDLNELSVNTDLMQSIYQPSTPSPSPSPFSPTTTSRAAPMAPFGSPVAPNLAASPATPSMRDFTFSFQAGGQAKPPTASILEPVKANNLVDFNLNFQSALNLKDDGKLAPSPAPESNLFSINPRLANTPSAFDISSSPPPSPSPSPVSRPAAFNFMDNGPTNAQGNNAPPQPTAPPAVQADPFAFMAAGQQPALFAPPASTRPPPSDINQPSNLLFSPFVQATPTQQQQQPALFQHQPPSAFLEQPTIPFLQQPAALQQQQPSAFLQQPSAFLQQQQQPAALQQQQPSLFLQQPSGFPQQQAAAFQQQQPSLFLQQPSTFLQQPAAGIIQQRPAPTAEASRFLDDTEDFFSNLRGREPARVNEDEEELTRVMMEDKLSKVLNYEELTEEQRKDCIIVEVAYNQDQTAESPFLHQQQQKQRKTEQEEQIKKSKIMDDEFVLLKKQTKVRINREVLTDLKKTSGIDLADNKKPFLGVNIIQDYTNTNYKNNIFILPKEYPKSNFQFILEQFTVQITLYNQDQPNEYLKKSEKEEKEEAEAKGGKGGERDDNIEIKLSKMQLHFYLFESKTKNWRLAMGIKDIEINDNIFASNRNKFLCYDPKWLRYLDSNMIQLLMEQNSYPIKETPDVPADYLVPKLMLKLSVLPLRLFVDQESKEFLLNFLTQKILYENKLEDSGSIYEEIQISDIPIRVDYKAKSIDLCNFDFLEILNWCSLKGAKFKLQRVTIRNKKPADVFDEITKQWKSYLRAYALGLGPVAAVKNIASGVSKLVTIPYEYYTEKDGKLIIGLKKGTTEFSRAVGYELLNIGAGVSTAIQKGLEYTDGLIDYTRPEDIQNVVNRNRNNFARPESTVEGLKQGLVVLKNAGNVVQKCLIAVPKEQYDENGINGFVKAAVHAIPVMLITPLKAGGESVGILLNGAANALRGEEAEMKLKYKPN